MIERSFLMQQNNDDDKVKIRQVNPQKELSDLEKTAILQFKIEQKEEELSKTTQFKLLNKRVNKADNVKEKRLAEIYESSAYILKVREGLMEYYEGDVVEPCYGQHCRSLRHQ